MKIIKIIIFIIFIIFTPKSFGYSTDTHAALTQEIIDFYNQFFEKKISNSLKDFLIDGARREDDFPRYFNHFYDPVYDRGLNDKIWGKGISARIWAQDELKQKNIVYKVSQTIASILSAFQRRKIEDIEFETNYTWQKAINFYLNGDIEKAMFSLGHILHLIEDMGVPAHTRNDGHPAILGDEEIYEVWSDRFKQNNIKTSIKDNLKDKKPIILNSLDDYFINLSTYTNNNFFSNDTIGIQSGYDSPQQDYLEKIGDYYYGIKRDYEFGEYKLFLRKSVGLLNTIITNENNVVLFLPKIGGDLVLNDYWKLLSTKVIQYGAGVIDLYFKEVEKAKNNFVPDKNKNFLGQLFEAIKDFYNNLFNNQLKEELNLELERENSQVDNFYNKGEEEKKREEFIFCGFQTNKKPILETLIINEVAWMGDFESYNNEWIELKNISNNSINLKGYQIIDQAEQIKFIFKEDKILKPKEFIVLKRGRDYSGILANTNEGLRLFDSDCNLLDEVFAKPNWPAGNNEDKKTMERNQEFIWLDSLKALGTPGKENSVYFIKKGFDKEENKEKEDKKTKNDLNVKKEDLTEENEKEENLNTNFVTSSTSSSFDIKKDKNLEEKNKICSFNTHLLPTYKNLIINEVAWMGDFESYNNEWIELKNISGRDLDITNYQLIDQNEQIKFTFSNFVVKKDSFVLLKRSPANFLKDVKEDFVYSGALANSNEGLRLFDSDCNLLDEVFAKPNWPAGNNQTKKTMERRNDFTWQNSLNFGGTPKRENSSGEILENKGINDLMVNNKSENDSNNISNLKILINQVKIMPVGERMIELYNPNEVDIDLTNWYLQRKTKTSDNFVSLVSKNYFENKIIPKKGFLLISRINIADSDIIVNNLTLSDDNVIQLKNKDGQVVDKVGWGEVGDYEGSSLPNFSNLVIKRKYLNNNFVDTDNNFNDFEIINCFIPKSSSFTCNLNENNKFLGTLAKKIVISEVKLEGEDKNDEFIELYNPLDEDVDLSNFSLQYKSNASDIFSTTTIFKKNFLANQKIKAKGFFLIARGLDSEGKDGYLGNVLPDLTYRSFALSSNLPGGTIFLVNNQEIITGLDDENIVDFVNYEKLILKGYKNFERKTFLDGYCYSAQKDYEFLGNSCLENEADYFDFRDVPRPQNFFSLVEPREKPVVQDFNIVFNSSTLSLEFSWSTSSEDVIYQVDLVNDNSSFVFKTTTLNNFSERIYEIGKEFNFSLKAIDAEGLSSDLVYKNIYVPSFLEKVYFYKKNYKGNDIYLIDLFYKQYPFIIYDFYQPKALVFYLNKATVTPVFQFDYDEYVKYYANFKVIPDASLINYHPCYNSGNLFDFTFYNKISSFLPLPNTSTYFCSYGWDSSFYKNNALDLNHIVLALASVPYELTNQDYLNIAFYNLQYFWSYYSSKTYDLIAIDRSKYYYQEEPDYLLDFKPITFLNYDILNVDNENKKAKIKIYWNKDETIFTLDGHIDYFYNFNNSEEWQNIITDNLELEVDLNKNYVFKLKAQDNLNRIQEKTLDVFISSDIF